MLRKGRVLIENNLKIYSGSNYFKNCNRKCLAVERWVEPGDETYTCLSKTNHLHCVDVCIFSEFRKKLRKNILFIWLKSSLRHFASNENENLDPRNMKGSCLNILYPFHLCI